MNKKLSKVMICLAMVVLLLGNSISVEAGNNGYKSYNTCYGCNTDCALVSKTLTNETDQVISVHPEQLRICM